MFSGIVQDMGRVLAHEARGGDVRLTVGCGRLELSNARIGDSLCVQGCCLTAVELNRNSFAADVSRETLALTTLGELEPGTLVNLEPALRAGDPLGGHLVSGHIDGVALVTEAHSDARSLRLTIETSAALARYLAPKGSVAVDGVSLTINAVQGASFGVNIIPHTRMSTTLGRLAAGARVNLEVDQVARYVARLLEPFGGLPRS
ncbi:MAG TPA: riboflavin synthase [Steroidobacteraceae bacterium]|nr:riboflavin synthase [Steroidobacteraceae bacterium]